LFPLVVVGAISWHLASSQLGQEREAARIEALVHLTEVAGDLANQVVVEEYVKYGELKMPGITSLPSIAPLVSKTVRVGQGALDAELHTVLARKDLRPLWWVAGALRQARALASRPEAGANQILDVYGALVDRIGAVAEQATGTMTADGVGTSGALAIVRDVRAFNQMNTTSADVGDLSGLMILYEGTDPVGRPAVDKEIFGAVSVFRSDVASLRASGSPAIWRIWEKTLADESDAVVAVTLSFANSAFSALSLPGLQVVGAPDLASLIRLAQTSLPVEQSVRTTEQQAGSLITAAAEQMARTAQENLDANIGLLGLLVIATFAFTVLLYRGVRDPMRDLAGRARRFSEGDFSIPGRVRLPAEVAAALDDAIRNFDQLKSQADALAAGELSNPALKQAVPGKLGTSLFHSVTRVRELQQRLLHEARHDALTGLYNRRAAIEALGVSLEVESRAEVGVMFIDLDGFKQVNDLYGHRAGDEVLMITAERLQAGVRPTDLVCRLGGDEFVVLVSPGTTLEQSVNMAARLLRALGVPIKTAAATIRVGASAGIAVSDPAFPATTSELLAQADAAVYRAKSDGRGGVSTSKCASTVMPTTRWPLSCWARCGQVRICTLSTSR
jgi:diguanylate cyclase (GGDEF)-like protein